MKLMRIFRRRPLAKTATVQSDPAVSEGPSKQIRKLLRELVEVKAQLSAAVERAKRWEQRSHNMDDARAKACRLLIEATKDLVTSEGEQVRLAKANAHWHTRVAQLTTELQTLKTTAFAEKVEEQCNECDRMRWADDGGPSL